MNFAEEIKGWLGIKLKGITLNIDIVDGCFLRCPSCAVGSIGPRRGHRMSIDTFRRILDKAGHVRKVQLYVYSDPLVHPDLHLFVQECTDRGIKCLLATVLQKIKCDMAKVIEARPAEIRIGFPGFDHMRYYQQGALPIIFLDYFYYLDQFPRYPETKWTIAFHLYGDNRHELMSIKQRAEDHGYKFVVIPAIFMVGEKVVEKDYSEQDLELISRLLMTPEEAIARYKYLTDYCLMWKQITLDSHADVYLCQLIYRDHLKLGNFFDMPNKEILRKMKTHPFCWECMQKGGHVYQYCYTDFTEYDDPVGIAEKRRSKRDFVSPDR